MAGHRAPATLRPARRQRRHLWAAATALADEYPGLLVHAVVGDFHRHIDRRPERGQAPGGLSRAAPSATSPRRSVAASCSTSTAPLGHEDRLLLGTDLVKDRARLVAAYDDAAGVTAAFNRNVLHVLNRELRAHFDPDAFEHVALWDEERAAGSRCACGPTCDQARRYRRSRHARSTFDAGEDLLTEISAKFTPEGVDAGALRRPASWSTPCGRRRRRLPPHPGTPLLLSARTAERPHC